MSNPNEIVMLRFMLSHGPLVNREMPLAQAVEVIHGWRTGHYKMTPGKRYFGENNGIKSFGVDIEAVVYMDITPLPNQPPVVPPPNFAR